MTQLVGVLAPGATLEDARAMLAAGADRVETSDAELIAQLGEVALAGTDFGVSGDLAGSMAELARALDEGAEMLRVGDVAAARDFILVRAALHGEADVSAGLELPHALRWAPAR